MQAAVPEPITIVVRYFRNDSQTMDVIGSAAVSGFDDIRLARDPENEQRMLVVRFDCDNEPFAGSILASALDFVAGVDGKTAEQILKQNRERTSPIRTDPEVPND